MVEIEVGLVPPPLNEWVGWIVSSTSVCWLAACTSLTEVGIGITDATIVDTLITDPRQVVLFYQRAKNWTGEKLDLCEYTVFG